MKIKKLQLLLLFSRRRDLLRLFSHRLRRRRRALDQAKFPRQLVHPRHRHESVNGQEVVVDRRDLRREAGPNEASGRHGALLRRRDGLGRSREVRDVGEGDAPLEGRGPVFFVCVVVVGGGDEGVEEEGGRRG